MEGFDADHYRLGRVGLDRQHARLLPKPSSPPSLPMEAIRGSDLKRVVLTPKAAERLAIATAAVKEEAVKRWLVA